MKKRTLLVFASLTLGMLSTQVKAQETNTFGFGELNGYFDAYLEPFGQALSTGLSGGWTTTAEVHKLFGADLTFSGSLIMIPDVDKTFDASNIMDASLYTLSGNVSGAPTIAASNDIQGPSMERTFSYGGYSTGLTIPTPPGTGLGMGASAAIQVGFGLPKGTEVMGRFVPDVSKIANKVLPADGVQMEPTGLWGIGVKHDIKQWIPVVKKLPFIQISGLVTYSQFKMGVTGDDFRYTPDSFTEEVRSELPESTWDNQSFNMEMSAFTGSLLVGASIPIFQPYIGIGFNRTAFDAGFKGKYPLITFNTSDPLDAHLETTDYEENPLNVQVKDTDFNFQAGARLKLAVFVIHYTYVRQKYNMHTAGIGFTFR